MKKITKKKPRNNPRTRFRSPKRRAEDREARRVNSPNGGCFHTIRWVREQEYEDRQLKNRINACAGPCRTYKASPEEMKVILAQMGITVNQQEESA